MAKKKKIAVSISKAAASKSSGLSEMEESRRRFAEAASQEQQQQQPGHSSRQGSAQSSQPSRQQQQKQSKSKLLANRSEPDDMLRFATFGVESPSSRSSPPTLSPRNRQRFMYLYETAVSMQKGDLSDVKGLAFAALIVDMMEPHPDGPILAAPMDELDAMPMESLPSELQLLKRGIDMNVQKKILRTVPPGSIPPSGIGPVMMPPGGSGGHAQCIIT